MRAEDRITAATRSRARLRASDSDRERVLDIVKTAFVQGRLTKDELDLRVGRTLASRTWGDLTAVTSDIPAWPLPQPARKNARTPSRLPAHAVVKAVAFAIIALAAIVLANMPGTWSMPAPPTMDAQACRMFAAWQNPVTRNGAMLQFAVVTASKGSDPALAADLTALQQAFQRWEDASSQPQSAATGQLAKTLQADTSQVTADCQSTGY